MKKLFSLLCISLLILMISCNNEPREVKIKVVATTDVHGSYFPFDFIKNHQRVGSLARVNSYLKKQYDLYGKEHVIYVDNGDILQGQPCAYYFNHVDKENTHKTAEILNYMECAVGTLGNHDIETGHPVFDKYVKSCNFPIICANMVDDKTGEPYLEPYTIVKRDGVKIAFIGMTTPAVPNWLPKDIWSGLRFEDIETSASRWIKAVQEKEAPNIIIGLFHSGFEGGIATDTYCEDAVKSTAQNVPGFDAIIYGHDHKKKISTVINTAGDTVILTNAGANALYVSTLEFSLTMQGKNMLSKRAKITRPASSTAEQPDSLFMVKFTPTIDKTKEYVSRQIGLCSVNASTRDAFFGPSAFVDFIHTVQLETTGADISLACPLSFNTSIKAGNLHIRDMFNLYAFENRLCTMRLSGKQIKDILEMSYALWTNTMKSAQDHIMAVQETNAANRTTFVNPFYYFDSAAGIFYEVDVTKPVGEKVNIKSMANGSPFSLEKEYTVALNSYRAMGGGELLTKGAGLTHDEVEARLLSTSEEDMRTLLTNYITKAGRISPAALNQWKLIPERWTIKSSMRDRKLLFGTTD